LSERENWERLVERIEELTEEQRASRAKEQNR
jgi:hypothetical protein